MRQQDFSGANSGRLVADEKKDQPPSPQPAAVAKLFENFHQSQFDSREAHRFAKWSGASNVEAETKATTCVGLLSLIVIVIVSKNSQRSLQWTRT